MQYLKLSPKNYFFDSQVNENGLPVKTLMDPFMIGQQSRRTNGLFGILGRNSCSYRIPMHFLGRIF
jgi:hypothetical protein